jgi:hypothetical protein
VIHDGSYSCVSSNITQAARRHLFALRGSMGKLIKNHWARLIILTSACCESQAMQGAHTSKADLNTRPTSWRYRRLLLAQVLLRLLDQELRHRSKARPNPTGHQRHRSYHMSRLRVAITMGGGDTPSQKHSGQAAVVTTGHFERCAIIPDHQCGIILLHRMRRIFLGL